MITVMYSSANEQTADVGVRLRDTENWTVAEAESTRPCPTLSTNSAEVAPSSGADETRKPYDYEAAISLDPFIHELMLTKFDAYKFGRRIIQELDGGNGIVSVVRTVPELCSFFDELSEHEQSGVALTCLLEYTSVDIGDLHARLQAELYAWRDAESSDIVADPLTTGPPPLYAITPALPPAAPPRRGPTDSI